MNKKLVRKNLEKIFGRGIEKAVIGSDIKIISFDMFDTLIIRNVPMPEDVFELIKIKYERMHPENSLKSDFAVLRREAEKLARKKNKENGKKEITLKEIYHSIDELEETVKQELLQIEIETECAVCQPNYEVKAFFEQLVKQGYSVIITSDMYLPETVIKDILKKCGYLSYTALYVSSKYGETKAAGTLFDRVLLDFQIKSQQLLHIGDHCRADYWIPKQKGIQTFLYRKTWKQPQFFKMLRGTKKHFSKEQQLQFQMLQRIMINCSAKRDQNEKIGYEILAPLLLGYTMWLKKEIGRSKADSLVFLAREGALLKRAFETLYPNEAKTHYVNVSRLATCRASAVDAKSWEELCTVFAGVMREVENAGDFLRLLGIPEIDKKSMEECHIEKSMHIEKIENPETFFELIKIYGNKYFKEQNVLLKEYLQNNGFQEEKIALTDIGWSGTMQLRLSNILPNKKLEGYYLAVSDFKKTDDYRKCKRNGYFCSAGQWEQDGKMIRFTQAAIEALFLGNEGTTLEYQKENGKVIPVKAELENGEKSVKVVEAVQNAAICFLEDCRKADILFFFELLDKQVAWEACFRFLAFPTKETIKFYKQLWCIDGMNHFSFVPKYSVYFYLFHPAMAKKELEVNTSKVIWLKALLKLPLPYYQILCFLTGKIGMKSNYQKKYFKE